MAKISLPRFAAPATAFDWTLAADVGATWTARFTSGNATPVTTSGTVPSSGLATIHAAGLAAGTWTIEINCSDGTSTYLLIEATNLPVFPWTADFGAAIPKQPKLRRTQFGDGYVQAAPSGLNFNPESWDLTFSGLSSAEAMQVMLFLDSYGGYRSFAWVNPDGFSRRYTCGEYSKNANDVDDYTVKAKFVQAFI